MELTSETSHMLTSFTCSFYFAGCLKELSAWTKAREDWFHPSLTQSLTYQIQARVCKQKKIISMRSCDLCFIPVYVKSNFFWLKHLVQSPLSPGIHSGPQCILITGDFILNINSMSLNKMNFIIFVHRLTNDKNDIKFSLSKYASLFTDLQRKPCTAPAHT